VDASEDLLMCGTNDTQVLGCCNGMVRGSGSCCDDGASAWSIYIALWDGRCIPWRYAIGMGKLLEKLGERSIQPNKQW